VTFSPRHHAGLAIILGVLVVSSATGQDRPPPVRDPAPRVLSEHQDSVRLTRLTSAVLPADGLLAVRLQLHKSDTVFILNDFLNRINQYDYSLGLEAGLRPWLHFWAEMSWRSWSEGQDWIPATGSGWGDGRWQLSTGRALATDRVHLAVLGGGNIPLGSASAGLTEGVYSPQVAAALTLVFWRESQLPEMRLHLNLGRTWNRAEETGYGAGTEFLQPWPPRYPSAADAGGNRHNDTNDLGIAVEFRAGTTSLWAEYSQQIFAGNSAVSRKEQMRMVAAGLRWGLVESWAVHGNYLISLADDDEQTPWWPGYPDMVMSVGVSRQFSIGGADGDDDGVRDRRDLCPTLAEDRDGFQDEDGCPDFDNDQDGVPDVRDDEPDAPEDYDGFEDADGVPDPDNDRDGVLDRDDLCPDEAEDRDGHNDEDGCPDDFSDRDGDGIEDAQDACPDEAEDQDEFEDADGCPEADNDLDGIPDARDDCPDQAEDYDGEADDDGCPEVDGPTETPGTG
jgi:hypothetical protein